MEMDDDFELPTNSDVAAPASPVRKLKRLKKGSRVSKDPLLDQPQSENGAELEALSVEESQPSDLGSRLGSESLGGEGELLFSGGETRSGLELNPGVDDLSGGGESSSEFDDLSPGFDGVAVSDGGEMKSGGDGLGDDGSGAKRALDFESVDEEFGETDRDRNEEVLEQGNAGMEELEKKRRSSDALEEEEGKKKKSKKAKSGGGDETKSKVNKRRAEKERQEHLSQLHAETQRLLRETRQAEFKPVPIVKKPISSVLEKIRQRKLEVSKKSMAHKARVGDDNGSYREMELESEGVLADGTGGSKISNVVIEEPIAFQTEKGSNANAACMDESNHIEHLSSKSVSSQMDVDEAYNQAFRAPIDDTQDLFSDSQNTDFRVNTDTPSSPLEEDFPPSILAMNLKLNLDSAPPDDVSSDEEYNDKENVKPHSPGLVGSSSPVRVQAFLDDEAEEEDDGDHDHFLFQDSEEDEAEEDADELRDMIATGYKEKSIDGERRNELHQKWLEQQDASFSEKLMQKLKFGSKLRETMSPEENDAEEEDYQEFDNDDAEDVLGKNSDSGLPKKASVRANLRIAKQMMSQMFTDNDVYLSSDDEEIVKWPTRSCLFEKTEEQATFLSPAEDESCSEVFGRIKKLNIVPDTKKSKTSAITNMQHMGGNGIIPKVSFIRGSNHSQLSTRKRGLSTARCSFIFGRDDSNSMSASSMSEDSSDTFQREKAPARITTKFSSSQIKSRKEKSPPATVEKADASFFEILRHNSLHSKRKGTIIDQMIQTEHIEETIHTESIDHITRTVGQTMQKEFTAQRKKTQEVDKTIQSALASFRVGRTQARQRQNLVHM